MPENEWLSRFRSLVGKEAVDSLARRHVAVFGIGGVGGAAAEAVARSGIGEITLVDGDTVAPSNLNRQAVALNSTIGQSKAEVMKNRINDINPAAVCHVKNLFFDESTAPEFDFSQFDYIIDAIDSVSSKVLLICTAHEHGVSIVSAMGAGNKLDPSRFEVADIYSTSECPLARVMRGRLRKAGIPALKVVYSKEPPVKADGAEERAPASAAFVPPVMGLILAGEAVKDLIG